MRFFGTGRRVLAGLGHFLDRGRSHREHLAEADIRIAVSGTRGKSSVVTWLQEAFVARGYDTVAKVTGEVPHMLYNGVRFPITRDGPVMLYENERVLGQFHPEAIVVENQGIREYTTRLVNEAFVCPTLVLITNVRRDHLDTLGKDELEIARSLARAVPAGTPVVTGERNPVLADYLEVELARRGATLTRAIGDPTAVLTPGEETVAMLDATLRAVGAEPLSATEREDYRRRMDVRWTRTPGGRVYDAANVNDVESTELVRRVLQADRRETFQPLVYFRADRPGRTRSFIEYLNWLAREGLVEQVRGVGAHRKVVARRLDVPLCFHDETTESPAEVLDAALADGWPVIVMGNVVPEWMQALSVEIEWRAVRPPEPADVVVDEPTELVNREPTDRGDRESPGPEPTTGGAPAPGGPNEDETTRSRSLGSPVGDQEMST